MYFNPDPFAAFRLRANCRYSFKAYNIISAKKADAMAEGIEKNANETYSADSERGIILGLEAQGKDSFFVQCALF